MNVKLTAIALASLAIGALLAVAMLRPPIQPGQLGSAGQGGDLGSTGTALVGGPFSLVDHTGRRVTDRDYRGRYMLVFFGFTHCPDICPSGLSVMATTLDKLGADADKVAPLFVTIDPERDTPAKLAEYVASFSPRIIGLSGSREDVSAVVKAYRVYAKKVASGGGGDPGAYTMDHSTIAYLMGPDGAYRTFFPDLSKPDQLAAEIRRQIAKSR
jgi:protein SCO1/2